LQIDDGTMNLVLEIKNPKYMRGEIVVKREPAHLKSCEAEPSDPKSLVALAFAIVQLLKEETNEKKKLTQADLHELLIGKGIMKYSRTLSTTLYEIMCEMNPDEYTGDNLSDFRIRYRGLEDNRFRVRVKIEEERKKAKAEGKVYKDNNFMKVPAITDLWYAHSFSHEELDDLIESVYCSKFLSDDKQISLIKRLEEQTDKSYRSKFLSYDGKLQKNIEIIHENYYFKNTDLKKNVQIINEAIENNAKINFHLNYYTSGKVLEKIRAKDKKIKEYSVSPYHMAIYNGKYYLIANTDKYNNLSIYRIDLISDIRIQHDKSTSGKRFVLRKIRSEIPEFSDKWTVEKFVNQHLNMSYNKPDKIYIKLNRDYYTLLHDAFGEHYSYATQIPNTDFDLLIVTCTPDAMVRWAMQNSDIVEVDNQEIREEILKKTKAMLEKYDTKNK